MRLHQLQPITPETLFVHYVFSGDPKDARSIARNGFDLSRFGATARRFNAHEALTRYDPVGVFATIAEPGMDLDRRDLPYVTFRTRVTEDEVLYEGKEAAAVIHGKTGAPLTKALLKQGFKLLIGEIECIVLDTSVIYDIRVGS